MESYFGSKLERAFLVLVMLIEETAVQLAEPSGACA
jgi:hypothetical protein